MCFSALGSFSASVLLIPTGIYCLTEAMISDKAYVPISTWPLFFGLQQAVEGVLWLGIDSNELTLIHTVSLCFLFFFSLFLAVLDPIFRLLTRN